MRNLTTAFWREGRLGSRSGRQGVVFGQTRDDVEVERFLVAQIPHARRVLVITSGGCAALTLADLVASEVLSVDVNPAQNRLAALKITAWRALDRQGFHHLLCGDVRKILPQLPPALRKEIEDFAGRSPLRHGLQNCGRADAFLRGARRAFLTAIHPAAFVQQFLSLADSARQKDQFIKHWDTWRWRAALRLAFHPMILRLAFSRQAGALLPADFSTLLATRLRAWLTASPACTNGLLWQTFLGRYAETGLPRYLQPNGFAVGRDSLSKITLLDGDVREILDRQPPGSIDFASLSNVLELASPDQISRTLKTAAKAIAPGGRLLLRSILPDRAIAVPAPWRRDETLLSTARTRDRGGLCLPSLVLER